MAMSLFGRLPLCYAIGYTCRYALNTGLVLLASHDYVSMALRLAIINERDEKMMVIKAA